LQLVLRWNEVTACRLTDNALLIPSTESDDKCIHKFHFDISQIIGMPGILQLNAQMKTHSVGGRRLSKSNNFVSQNNEICHMFRTACFLVTGLAEAANLVSIQHILSKGARGTQINNY
jgi:hypothetical protein